MSASASSSPATGATSPGQKCRNLFDRYGARGLVRLAGDLFLTRLFFSPARLIRRPFYFRGTRWIQIGKGFTTGPGLRLDAFAEPGAVSPVLTIGCDVQVNDYVHIAAVCSVVIGDRVLMGSKVFVSDHNHGTYSGDGEHSSPAMPPAERPVVCAPVRIEDDVWIGETCSILPGVTIGKGSIIGTMSVVTHNVPPYSIAVGSPARVIKRFDFATGRWETI